MPGVRTPPSRARHARGEAAYLVLHGRTEGRSDADESLATVVHELRTPLTTILFAVGLIPEGRDRATREACSIVKRQVWRAVRLVDDLFDVCAVSRGTLSVRKELVDLASVIANVTETTAHVIEGRGHRLTVTLPSGPVPLLADPLRLEQVITNLLVNAAKFTEPGGHIRLCAGMEPGQVVVRVRDSGRGIDAELLPRVFDLFRRGQAHQDDEPDGLGLGLALVKSLVGLHGGTIEASSDGPGTGSEFVVRLPTCVSDA
jgi:signal transduction histidine kinase